MYIRVSDNLSEIGRSRLRNSEVLLLNLNEVRNASEEDEANEGEDDGSVDEDSDNESQASKGISSQKSKGGRTPGTKNYSSPEILLLARTIVAVLERFGCENETQYWEHVAQVHRAKVWRSHISVTML